MYKFGRNMKFVSMNKEEIKYVLNLFATDLISEIENGMKQSNCNQCAKGYFDSGMIVKKRLKVFLDKVRGEGVK